MTDILSSDDLLAAPVRELILLAGKDGSGKSSALVSLAAYLEMTNPSATFFVIDTENKFGAALRAYGPPAEVPKNIKYFSCPTMNDVTNAAETVIDMHAPGDWLAVESMSRVWERAQDLGYQAIVGTMKAAYMEKRQQQKKNNERQAPVTPRPDDLWSIVKGAHDAEFLDRICNTSTLNAILTTTVSKPPKADSFRKESQGRQDVRAEFGIDMGFDGAPRLPYYFHTTLMMQGSGGSVTCRVLRDNLSNREIPNIEFSVDNKRTWALDFFSNCRG